MRADGDGVIAMAVDAAVNATVDSGRCAGCGGPLAAQRRLVPSLGGSWVVASVAVCVNPACTRNGQRRDAAQVTRADVA